MPPLPKKKHSKGRKGNKASHFGLKKISKAKCPQCQSARMPHHACPSCGNYNGRSVVTLKTPTVSE